MNFWDDKEDKEKERERKERIQHPHHIKSKSHWDWDSGYDTIPESSTQNGSGKNDE